MNSDVPQTVGDYEEDWRRLCSDVGVSNGISNMVADRYVKCSRIPAETPGILIYHEVGSGGASGL